MKTNVTYSCRMDKNLKTGTLADKRSEKRDLKWTKTSKNVSEIMMDSHHPPYDVTLGNFIHYEFWS